MRRRYTTVVASLLGATGSDYGVEEGCDCWDEALSCVIVGTRLLQSQRLFLLSVAQSKSTRSKKSKHDLVWSPAGRMAVTC